MKKIADFESFLTNLKLGHCKICYALNIGHTKHNFLKDICKSCESEGKKKLTDYIYKNSKENNAIPCSIPLELQGLTIIEKLLIC